MSGYAGISRRIKGCVLQLSAAVQKGEFRGIEGPTQRLEALLRELADHVVSLDIDPNQAMVLDAQLGFQTLMGLKPEMNVLVDGPDLFPMITSYLKRPWCMTNTVSHFAFGFLYNLAQLNSARFDAICENDGITALKEYYYYSVASNEGEAPLSSASRTKLNLFLAFLYQLSKGREQVFVSEGVLDLVLRHAHNVDHVLVFLSSFLHQENLPETIHYVVNHKEFLKLVQTTDPNSPRLKLVITILRNLALSPNTQSTILPLIPRMAEGAVEYMDVDNLLSIVSNLAATNQAEIDWSAFFSAIFPSILKKLEAHLLEIGREDQFYSASDQINPSKRHFWARLMQILKQPRALEASRSCAPEQAKTLMEMVLRSDEFVLSNPTNKEVLARYFEGVGADEQRVEKTTEGDVETSAHMMPGGQCGVKDAFVEEQKTVERKAYSLEREKS
ncbi:uncharacterized protein LOC126318432 [Schistocerca gregaria]|uniref:uncharacterized protein LOC126318432 n=1 Tax=Schistocerca gregaria TaxID=7010 RepID=UPI00211EF947|nr:uncharacterized protein LOC126318432 [Schistocerca gregaria]